MAKFSKKLHYIVKYLIIALPILLILLSYCHSSFAYGTTSVSIVNSYKDLLANLDFVFDEMLLWPINAPYDSLLMVLTGNTYNPSDCYILNILTAYPLYVFWVYIFDILLDVICFIPKFIHNLFERLSD